MKTIQFEVAGKEYSLLTCDDMLSHNCAVDIVTGRSYPFPDWVPEPKVVLDIGGHVGEFSVVASIMWPKAEVHCFEPNPKVQGILKENAVQYGFRVHEAAVSDQQGQVEYRISGFGAVANSIVDRPNQTGKSVTVEAHDAKLFMGWKPDVIKLDCEGSEVPILTRIRPTPYFKDVELIYIEFHTEGGRFEIDQLLKDTHCLSIARIWHKDQGELMYVKRKRGSV